MQGKTARAAEVGARCRREAHTLGYEHAKEGNTLDASSIEKVLRHDYQNKIILGWPLLDAMVKAYILGVKSYESLPNYKKGKALNEER